jgi:hypothetical protein
MWGIKENWLAIVVLLSRVLRAVLLSMFNAFHDDIDVKVEARIGEEGEVDL